MAALFALLSRAGAFVPLGGISTNSFASKTANTAAARPRATRGFSYRPSNAVVMAAEKKAVFGGGCFWWVDAVFFATCGGELWGGGGVLSHAWHSSLNIAHVSAVE